MENNFLVEASETMMEKYGVNINDAKEMMDLYKEKGTALKAFIEMTVDADPLLADVRDDAIAFIETSISEFLVEATASADVAIYAGFQPMLLKEHFARRIGKKLTTTTVTSELSPTYGVFETVFIDKAGVEHKLSDITTATEIDLGWYNTEIPVGEEFKALDDANLSDKDKEVKNKLLDLDTSIIVANFVDFGEARCKIGVGYDGTLKGTATFVPADGSATTTEVLYGMVDLKTGSIVVQSATGLVDKVTFKYRLSNTYSEINSFETRLKYEPFHVRIGDGELINFGIPMNFLNDIKAFGSIDGLTKASEAISSAHATLDDRALLILANATAEDNGLTSTVSWSKDVPAGTSVIDHNTSLLFAINSAIAISDNSTQFSSVREFNIACNPIDANIVTSPVVIRDALENANVSVVGGALNYKTTSIVSNSGDVNLLSTKLQAQGDMIIVPKSGIEEEKVIAEYKHSNVFYGDNSYRMEQAPNIKSVATRSRKEQTVHNKKAVTKVTITD